MKDIDKDKQSSFLILYNFFFEYDIKYPKDLHDQHCRSKDKVIWTANIYLPGTHQLEQGPW